MKHRLGYLGVVLISAATLASASAPTALAAAGADGPTRLTGPWYTPGELKALNAYSAASFSEKQALLAGRGETTPLAGPSYTPSELRALIAYSNASPAEKAALAGIAPVATSGSGEFHWADAGVGAAAAGGSIALIGGLGLLFRNRPRLGRSA